MVSLCQGQQQVLFYSSHAFGFFSPSQVDLQCPFFSLQALLLVVSSWGPCADLTLCILQVPTMHGLEQSTLWLGHGARILVRASALATSSTSETELLTRTGRVLLALQDGDVLVYATTRGKSKAAICNCYCKAPWSLNRFSWFMTAHTHIFTCTQLHSGKSVVTIYGHKWSKTSFMIWKINESRKFKNIDSMFFTKKWIYLHFSFDITTIIHNPYLLIQACDLALKFPHVSVLPFKLHSFRGWPHVPQSVSDSHFCYTLHTQPKEPTARFSIDMQIYADILWYMMIWDMICFIICIHLIIKFL